MHVVVGLFLWWGPTTSLRGGLQSYGVGGDETVEGASTGPVIRERENF